MRRITLSALILSVAIFSCEKPAEPQPEPAPEIPVERIESGSNLETVNEGASIQMTAYALPSNATNKTIVWTSSDESVASVNSSGLVTGKKIGSVEIKASSADGKRYISFPIAVLPKGSINLSEVETANSYIVSEPGSYAVKLKTVSSGFSFDWGEALIRSVRVLWESYGDDTPIEPGALVNLDYLIGQYIVFTAGSEHGNAVISSFNPNGKALYSCHIWLTEKPEEQVYKNGAGVFLDRNLGATSCIPDDPKAVGLVYQWARIHPFLTEMPGGGKPASTIEWPAPKHLMPVSGTDTMILLESENPTIVNTDRYYFEKYNFESKAPKLSSSAKRKSTYDPCPPGYRVPDGGEESEWILAAKDLDQFQTIPSKYRYGADMAKEFLEDESSVCWYPITQGESSYMAANVMYRPDIYPPYNDVAYGPFSMYMSNTYGVAAFCPMKTGGFGALMHVRCIKDESKEREKIIPVKSYTLNPYNKTMAVGEKQTLSCTVLPEDASFKHIVWTALNSDISNPAISLDCTTGEITALRPGWCTLTARLDVSRDPYMIHQIEIRVIK